MEELGSQLSWKGDPEYDILDTLRYNVLKIQTLCGMYKS